MCEHVESELRGENGGEKDLKPGKVGVGPFCLGQASGADLHCVVANIRK